MDPSLAQYGLPLNATLDDHAIAQALQDHFDREYSFMTMNETESPRGKSSFFIIYLLFFQKFIMQFNNFAERAQ